MPGAVHEAVVVVDTEVGEEVVEKCRAFVEAEFIGGAAVDEDP